MSEEKIDRRDFMKAVSMGATAAAAKSYKPEEANAGTEKLPNILLLMTDQQRFDSLGCYGCKIVPTPNFDRLAKEGALFENCYVNNPICTPSRASILTGKPLPGHNVYRLHDIIPKDQWLFPKHLQSKSYKTALLGKLHVSGWCHERDFRSSNDGFDIFEPALDPFNVRGKNNSYGQWLKKNHPEFHDKLAKKGGEIGNIPVEVHFTHWAAERTINFLESREKDKPFFCFMSVVDPHDPYNCFPEEYVKLVNESEIPDPVIKEGQTEASPEGVRREHEHNYLGGFDNYTKKQIHQMREGYYAAVGFVDWEVGRVLDVLEKQGIKDNTLIIFASDHGDMLGDHELMAKGAFFYDPCVKVPLIMRFPGKIKRGKRVKELVQPHDIAATILAQAGISQDKLKEIMPDSIDLISMIQNKPGSEKARDHAVCMYPNTSIGDNKLYWDPPIHAKMFRDKKYKLNVYNYEPDDKKIIEGELYDMESDPYEIRNLWDDPKYDDIKLQLLGRLMNWITTTDYLYNSSEGGEMFPPKSQWSRNKPL